MDKYGLLEKLWELKNKNLLTSEEFNFQKNLISSWNDYSKYYKNYENILKIWNLRDKKILSEKEFNIEKSKSLPSIKEIYVRDYRYIIVELLKRFLSFKWRIWRLEYFIYFLILFYFSIFYYLWLLSNISNNFILVVWLWIIIFYIFLVINIKRLHDINLSGYWFILFFTQIFFLILLLKWWTKWSNKFWKYIFIKDIFNKWWFKFKKIY